MNRSRFLVCFLVLSAFSAFWPALASAAEPDTTKPITQVVPAEAQAQPLDVQKAVDAYLALSAGPERERSDAYFDGNCWLQLWNMLLGLGIAALLLFSRAAVWMRERAERITQKRWLQPALFYVQYTLVHTLLTFPLDLYQDYFREHRYGLSNLSLGGWFGELGKALALNVVLGSLFVAVLYGIFRRAPRNWWVLGAAVTFGFLAFTVVIGPVFLEPVFNKFTPLADGPLKARILSLARANQIPVSEVYEEDSSKQTNAVSAHVSGFMGTERIVLNDNLVHRASIPQVEAVMAHEMGHYVLEHIVRILLFFALVVPLAFFFLRVSFERLRAWSGERWGLRDVSDPAGFVLLMALLSLFGFLAMPVTNSFSRATEQQADQFGVNAAQQPDAFAQVALNLGEYRKLDPTPFEEIVFFDHPSGRRRIQTAMRWKAEHLGATPRP